MITPKLRPTIGQCEVCDVPNVEVYKSPQGNMWMCRKHYDEEQAAYAKSVSAAAKIAEFRKSDASISTKVDIHLVNNVPMVELQAAIQNDATIPVDKKDETYADECLRHRNRLDEIISGKRGERVELDKEIQALELERKLWIVNGQAVVGKLHAEAQAKYRELNINYTPSAPTKREKTTKVKKGKSEADFKTKEFYAALEKYKVKAHATMIRMNMLKRNCSAEQAARDYADTLGLLD